MKADPASLARLEDGLRDEKGEESEQRVRELRLPPSRDRRVKIGEVMAVVAIAALGLRWPAMWASFAPCLAIAVLRRLGLTRPEAGAVAVLLLVLGVAVAVLIRPA